LWWPSQKGADSVSGLAQFWLFAELGEQELQNIMTVAVRRTVPGGTVLFRQGDPTPGLHLVERGAIKIYTPTEAGEERIIDLVGAGECCGEMGVVDRAPSAAWGEAMGQTRLWVVPADAFERLLLSHPATCLKICRLVVAKLRLAGSQLEETLFLSSRERVLRHLVRLAERHGSPAPAPTLRLPVRLTHQEVARLAGTARETVSRVLAELQDRRLLSFADRQMEFTDLPALRALAGLAPAAGAERA
jgi:CRP/FNR family transcriptional regulator